MIIAQHLVWDKWNVDHIARHGVTPKQVEEVCHGKHVVRETYGGRLMIIGQTEDNKLLAMVLAPKDKGEYYPITAYIASGKLRRIYYQEKGKEEES